MNALEDFAKGGFKDEKGSVDAKQSMEKDSREGAFDISMEAYTKINSEYEGVSQMNDIPESVEYGSEVDMGNLRGYLD